MQTKEAGFALLMSLIVVGVVVSVGMAILDLTLKQVRLSTNVRESEEAFHAANAGMECARYWRRASSSEMENGQAINPTCFGVSPVLNVINNPTAPVLDDTSDGSAFLYTYQFTWGSGGSRCTEVNALVASSSVTGNGATTTNMLTLIPGYPPSKAGRLYCEPGARCSVVSVRGYNRPCSTIGAFGTVEREVLLQF